MPTHRGVDARRRDAGLTRPREWMERVELTGDIQEPSELVARTEQAAEESRNRGAGAKERLLARRRNSTPSA